MEHLNNSEFVGNQEKFRYLAIHGYEKFQKDKYGKLPDGSRQWIKDACRKDSDPDYVKLSISERYTLDAMRRLTGLHGKWCPNDPMWVARGTCVGNKERRYVTRAVLMLVRKGVVTLSNEPLRFAEVREQPIPTLPRPGGMVAGAQGDPEDEDEGTTFNPQEVPDEV